MSDDEIKTEEEAKQFIIKHLKEHPELHRTPEHLQNTYSGMGGHPIRYCKDCRELIEKFHIYRIEGVKVSMYQAYYEEIESKKED